MQVDFNAMLGACMDAFADIGVLTPVASQPGAAGYLIRGVFSLKGADIMGPADGVTLRADVYTFGVRVAEFPILVARGDLLSDVSGTNFPAFLAGRVFAIEDTGDDGMGHQEWILKEQRDEDDEP